MRAQRFVLIAVMLAFTGTLLLLAVAPKADAIPAFSRKYQTSCATCHVAFPKLNAFGEAFRNQGYRMPGGDEQYEADEPVSLGAEPWKRLWPEAIWPGSVPYLPPVSFYIDNTYVVEPGADINNDFLFPNNVSLLTGGTFGSTFSFYGRINLFAPGQDLHVHRLFGQANDLGTNLFNVRFGQMEPRAVPFSRSRSLITSDYLINSQTFPLREWLEVGEGGDDHDAEADDHEAGADDHAVEPVDDHDAGGSDAHAHGGDFALGTTQQGIEVWGVADGFGGKGGFEYGVGVVNGNGSGDFADTGSNDNNSSKDFYGRGAYKIGGLSLLGDPEGAPAQSDNWRDDSLTVGAFAYRGSAPFVFEVPEEEEGEHDDEMLSTAQIFALQEEHEDDDPHGPVTLTGDERYTRYGFDFDAWYRDLNVFGAYMWGETRLSPLSEDHAKADFTSWFTEADYVIYPWLIGAVRYEKVDLPEPMHDIERWIPHVTALIRANVKFTLDAEINPDDDRRNRYLFNFAFAF